MLEHDNLKIRLEMIRALQAALDFELTKIDRSISQGAKLVSLTEAEETIYLYSSLLKQKKIPPYNRR